ncbi:LytR C-terminal domain-containing protein [Streptomyces sp. WMMB303]|uniref:LytR C-terminal domain-containing protein n=1 Tax=Streptomyces sp. WMMB303 TaxID=3034154 RepID=UPI0023EB1734|nr:LytR C-terminal domain-containing protein [Streptomyces sp. WMMB303]MDF4251574.1 LytR C-terminal domain-containing protein [Streptomyces sp. WMMB303]
MSMLTPPGLGGKYRIKGDRYPRMRRPRRWGRIVAASLASVLAAAVLGWGALQVIGIFSGSGPAKAADRSAERAKCASAAPAAEARTNGRKAAEGEPTGKKAAGGDALPEPGDITVNVLNATSRSGLAKDTADELKKRGFKIGRIGNASAEFDEKIKKAAFLVGAPGASTSARMHVLGTQLAHTETRYDERDGKDVDLILGNGFAHLAKKKAATAALAELAGPAAGPGEPGKPGASPSAC